MTRASLSGRLSKLEAVRQARGSGAGVFVADVGAGVWREVGAGGRVFRLEEDGPEGVRSSGAGLLFLSPGFPSKVLCGVTWGDL